MELQKTEIQEIVEGFLKEEYSPTEVSEMLQTAKFSYGDNGFLLVRYDNDNCDLFEIVQVPTLKHIDSLKI